MYINAVERTELDELHATLNKAQANKARFERLLREKYHLTPYDFIRPADGTIRRHHAERLEVPAASDGCGSGATAGR